MKATRRLALRLALALALTACRSAPPGAGPLTRAQQLESLLTLQAMLYAAGTAADAALRQELTRYFLFHEADQLADRTYPVRPRLLRAVGAWPLALRQKALAYVRANTAYATQFNAFVLESLGPAPAFTPTGRGSAMQSGRPEVAARAGELAALLAEVYRRGEVRRLLAEMTREWAELQPTAETMERNRRAVLLYLRWDPARPLPSFSALLNPFLRPGTGYSVELSPTEVVLVYSPALGAGGQDLLLAHELAHQPVYRLVHGSPAVEAALTRAGCAFAGLEHNPGGYATWESYLLENLVRNLSYQVIGQPDRRTEMRFEDFFAGKLAAYERDPAMRFEAFLVEALGAMPAKFCSADGGG